ncbi:MAG: hypothetical protein AABY53_07705 [Bdellovibrionota bacterium]
MKFIIVLLLPVFVCADHLSKYDVFELFYQDGGQATFEEVTGWWAGRCFKKDAPDKPLAFVLVAANVDGQNHMAIAGHMEDNEVQNRYDNMTDEDRAMFKSFERSGEFLSSEISSRDNALYSNIDLGVHAIKKYGGQFVALMLHSTNRDYDYRCHFFKKVN